VYDAGAPIRAFEHAASDQIPFAGPVITEVNRGLTDLIVGGEETLPGLYHLAGGLIHQPVPTAEKFGQATLHSLSPHQILLHPGTALLTAYGGGGLLASTAERAGAVGGILAREGALAPAFRTAITDAMASHPELTTPRAAAEWLGQGAKYDRAMETGAGGVEVGPKGVARQIGTHLRYGMPPRERLLQVPGGGTQAGWWYGKNPLTMGLQMAVDRAYGRFPNPRLLRSQSSRVKSAALTQATSVERDAASESAAYMKKWGKVSDTFGAAMKMVLEGTEPKDVLKFFKDNIASGKLKGKDLAATQAKIPLIEEASKYLTTMTHPLEDLNGNVIANETVPVLRDDAPPELHQFVTDSRNISNARTTGISGEGSLSAESQYKRTAAPRNFYKFRTTVDDTTRLKRQIAVEQGRIDRGVAGSQSKLAQLQHRLRAVEGQMSLHEQQLTLGEDASAVNPRNEFGAPLIGHLARQLVEKANLAYVPNEFESLSAPSFGTAAYRRARKFGRGAPPSNLTHTFQGKVLMAGGGRTDIAHLLAESYNEAAGFLKWRQQYNRIVAGAQDTPAGIPKNDRQLIRVVSRKQFMPTLKGAVVKALQPSEAPEDQVLQQNAFAELKNHFLPDAREALGKVAGMTAAKIKALVEGDDPSNYTVVPGHKWINKNQMGGFDQGNPLAQAFADRPMLRAGVRVADAVNNAAKMQVLYSRPAYGWMNMLGSAALTMMDQGVFAPLNLSKSAMSYFLFSPEDRALALHGVGGGKQVTLKAGGFTGRLSRFTSKTAELYGKAMDEPFRFAAFIHKAGDAGFKTGEEIHQLLTDPAYAATREKVFSRANDSMIDYERLGAAEQSVLRRFFFFYPWIKGSTRYASQYLKEHPVGAAVQMQAAQQGDEWSKRILGDLPSYMAGVIPYAGGPGTSTATIGNPASIGILNTPADLLKSFQNLALSGHPSTALAPISNLAPDAQLALALASAGGDTPYSHPANQSIYQTLEGILFGNSPWVRLYQGLQGKAAYPGSIYSAPTWQQALMYWGLTGATTPQQANLDLAHYRAWKQQHGPKFIGGNG
jgi:hypothetical protein